MPTTAEYLRLQRLHLLRNTAIQEGYEVLVVEAHQRECLQQHHLVLQLMRPCGKHAHGEERNVLLEARCEQLHHDLCRLVHLGIGQQQIADELQRNLCCIEPTWGER